MPDPTAEFVFALAAQRGWSQVEFAEKVSQTKQSVTNWRSRGIPPKHHAKVAKVFGITVEELLAAGKAAKGPRESLKTIFGVELSPEAANFAAEWMALRSPLRAQIQAIVQTLVQEQARDARNASVHVPESLHRRQGT
jgi:transcriptional regulator with XRE-family HTH domain